MVSGLGPVFVTGGSSGIGLAIALEAALHGHPLVLFARDGGRLAQAAQHVNARFPGHPVLTLPLDVTDSQLTGRVMAQAMATAGVPVRVILSAGVTLPGLWEDVPLAEQRRVMEVNFFGCLNVLAAVLPRMGQGGAIGFVGSAAGLLGIYGYGAYAPSKAALQSLAEVLRVELAGRGIGVTLSLPPDTDTPMLATERGMRPVVTRRMAEGLPVMAPDAVACHLWKAMERGRFLSVPGASPRLMQLFAPWIAPFLRWKQRRLIAALVPQAGSGRAVGGRSGQMFAEDMDEHAGNSPEKETDGTDHTDGQQAAGIGRRLR